MKQILIYGILLLGFALTNFSCSETEPQETPAGSGTLVMHLSATRTEGDSYDPFEHLMVKIFNADGGLIRKYTSLQTLPGSLQLLAGDYRITVEAGDLSAASFTNKSYRGETAFSIQASQTQNVEVACTLVNVVAEVKFDPSIAKNFGTDFFTWVCASDTFDTTEAESGAVPTLKYTADGKGYFILPAGISNLSWCFRGTHPLHGEVVKSGIFEDVKAAGKYVLTLRYSPDLPGFIDFSLSVDTSTDDCDDTIIFSPDPTIKGEDFDMEQVQRYTSGTQIFTISSLAALQTVTLTLGADTYDLMNPTQAGISTVLTNEFSMSVSLSDEFFTGCKVGDNQLTFNIHDADKGSLTAHATFRLQGLMPITETNCNLWSNTVTLQAVSFAPEASPVKLGLRTSAGEWIEQEAIRGNDDIYTASFAPAWEATTNDANLTVYTATPGTGIAVNTNYEYRLTIDGEQKYTNSFTTAGGDVLENAGMDNWSTYNVTGSSITGGSVPYPNASGSSFWVGGNNKQTNALCVSDSSIEGHNGSACAKLQPVVVAGIFAAGNLFTGTFACGTGLLDMFGFASFGQQYTFTARPKGLKLRYNATITNVTNTGGPLQSGIDPGRMFVCITDWTGRHAVKSGKSYDEKTFWDPAKTTALPEGAILGYGSKWIQESTSGWVEEVLPILWYDTDAAPSAGSYSLSISFATSAYGDYVAGSTNNRLYVEDFEWVY